MSSNERTWLLLYGLFLIAMWYSYHTSTRKPVIVLALSKEATDGGTIGKDDSLLRPMSD